MGSTFLLANTLLASVSRLYSAELETLKFILSTLLFIIGKNTSFPAGGKKKAAQIRFLGNFQYLCVRF